VTIKKSPSAVISPIWKKYTIVRKAEGALSYSFKNNKDALMRSRKSGGNLLLWQEH